jgi:S-adenosylmethionine hydrolase
MKGAIATINPQVSIIDLTHQIPPQNILAARFALLSAIAYFPQNTIHLAVVDPGVGSKRRGVAIAFKDGFLVGPDNGLFSGILALSPALRAVELTNPQYWLTLAPSTTFHGRDIFAPVAAHLARGISLEALGTEINPNELVKVDLPSYQQLETEIIGSIQYIDIFGNLITNIPARAVVRKSWSVVVDDLVIPRGETYSSIKEGEVVALVGSHGWVEIAVNGGNAKIKLQKNLGEQIKIKL